MTERYKTFPPGQGYYRVPMSSRRAALAGLCLWGACKPGVLRRQRIAWLAVRLLGPRALPGRASEWRPPIEEARWRALREAWRAGLGEFDSMAAYQRRQASRPGLACLLLRRGTPVAFVKVRVEGKDSLRDEGAALDAVWRFRPRSFSVPEPLLCGTEGEWQWLATAALPVGLHRPPARPPLDEILPEVEAALAGLPRPDGTPDHWRPMHGDFAPWNLRCIGPAEVVLLDWERAGWGPPEADRVLYRATWATLDGRPAERCAALEAIRFWRERVASWPATDTDHAFALALQARLREMEGGA